MADEKKLKWDFTDHLPDLGKLINVNNLRLYALEFPVKMSDRVVYADMLLEQDNSTCSMDNDLFVLEFKDKEIVHSALDQLNQYCSVIPKQLYRKGKVTGVLVSSVGFSTWELTEARKQGRLCVLFNGTSLRLA